jgi:hypothetical protein
MPDPSGTPRKPSAAILTPVLGAIPGDGAGTILLAARFARIPIREDGVHGSTLSIIWMLSLALFALRQVRFWAKKRPLAISIAAWLLYVALVYLRTVP